MSILDTIKSRRSVRGFQDKEISQDIIDDLIEALIWAPSAGNLQSRKFYFVTNQEIKDKLTEAALSQDFIRQAPLVIVGCADLRIERKYGERGKNLYSIQDVALSIQNLMLVAKEYGLGTCWVGAFDEEFVAQILNLPACLRPVAILPVGYPKENPQPPVRLSKDEAIAWVR